MKAIQLVSEPKIDPYVVTIDDELISQASGEVQTLNVPAIMSGAGTPSALDIVPSKAGDIYVDTTNSKIYIAKAATAKTDFLILN
jgi:hypothetical protein